MQLSNGAPDVRASISDLSLGVSIEEEAVLDRGKTDYTHPQSSRILGRILFPPEYCCNLWYVVSPAATFSLLIMLDDVIAGET